MDDLFCSASFLVVVIIIAIVITSDRRGRYKRKGDGTIYIYALMDGRKSFYVGQTTSPKHRLIQHKRDRSGNDKSIYISGMWRQPTMRILDKTNNPAKANKLENRYMRMYGHTNMKSA